MLNLNQPIGSCSAQDLAAALMLLHRDRDRMERILLDLACNRDNWQSFVLGPALPDKPGEPHRGVLASLRDLGMGWTANTLYILSPDDKAAKRLRLQAKRWGCSNVMQYSKEQSQQFGVISGMVSTMHWSAPLSPPGNTDYNALYSTENLPILLNATRSLGESSAQTLMVALMLRAQFHPFDPHLVLADLQAHSILWRSFVFGSALPDPQVGLCRPLELLSWLPDEWGGNHLYIWAWDSSDAIDLQRLCDRWQCDEVQVFGDEAAARLLHLPKAAPVIVASWSDLSPLQAI